MFCDIVSYNMDNIISNTKYLKTFIIMSYLISNDQIKYQ